MSIAMGVLTNETKRRRDLQIMKRRASILLLVMTVIFVAARMAESTGPAWVGYLRATAEAAMVGGLADWFAVSALFRHPLGLPIPHTAIVPTRKDQIGVSLGEFMQVNFLSADNLSERIMVASPAARIIAWLHRPGSAEIVARHLAEGLVAVTKTLRDDEVQRTIDEVVFTRLRQIDAAPLVGRVLEVATKDRRHQELVDTALRGFDRYLVDQHQDLRNRFSKESPWWVPESIDDRVFERLHTGLRGFLGDILSDPNHEARRHLDDRLGDLVARLHSDPELAARAESLKQELMHHPELRAWTAKAWSDAKASIVNQAGDPASVLRQRLASMTLMVADRLDQDEVMRTRFDEGTARLVGRVLDEYSETISDIIVSTVEKWDASVVTNQLELLLGRDLQFIRINGTVVGAAIGLCLHAIGQLLG